MTPDPDAWMMSTSPAALRQLAAACRQSSPEVGLSPHIMRQVLGPHGHESMGSVIHRLFQSGWTPDQIAIILDAIARTRELTDPPESLTELVLSGPEVEGISARDTFAVMNELFVTASEEVLLVGYTVYGGHELFKRLAERMNAMPGLKVWLCLDIPRRPGDSSLASHLVQRYAFDFFTRHWPWEPRPHLFYDTRSVIQESSERSSLHAKCVVVDRRSALITSANFTQAAQHRNIEAGVLLHHRPHVEKLAQYFEGLRHAGILARAQPPIT